jgi:tetratricopeptide (TPR) repeat protein
LAQAWFFILVKLADDLRRWLDGFPIQARPVSKLEHASRWCQRRLAFASLLTVLAFTLSSSLVGLLTLWRHSEAERGRAENALAHAIESDEARSDTVHDLVGLLAMTVDAPQMLASERFENTSRAVRDLTAKLRRHPRFATSNLVAICELERQLAADFWHRGNHAESRALLMDSLDLLEGRRYGADGPDVADAYARALMKLGRVAQNQKRLDEALVWYQRAEEALEGLVHDTRRLEEIALIDGSRRAIASIFGRSGRAKQRRRILESHFRMLERLSKNAGGDPAIGLLATLVRLKLAADGSTIGTLRAAIQRFPADRRLPAIVEQKVGVWMASDVSPFPSGPNGSALPMGRLDPEAHADLIIRALESRCKTLGAGHSLFSATIEDALRKALGEARSALRLDPNNAEARLDVAVLQDKLVGLPSGRRKPNQGSRHAATASSPRPALPGQLNVRR